MKEILQEEWLRKVLDSARDCRMRQLEGEFEDWKEYREVVQVKEQMFAQLEPVLSGAQRDALNLYDDAAALMVGRAQDYFYEQGFADCFRVLGRALAQLLVEQGRNEKK